MNPGVTLVQLRDLLSAPRAPSYSLPLAGAPQQASLMLGHLNGSSTVEI